MQRQHTSASRAVALSLESFSAAHGFKVISLFYAVRPQELCGMKLAAVVGTAANFQHFQPVAWLVGQRVLRGGARITQTGGAGVENMAPCD